ncbi:MAG: phosphatidate cytidylyltransferase [Mariprofundaceae bacterium]|nr:phosphatidate cytidylyltransferase [Mariprofundaceae bacterium]
MSELMLRVITAVVLLVGAVLWLFYVPAFWFDVILSAVAIAATVELLRMIKMPKSNQFLMVCLLMWGILIVNHAQGLWLPLAWMTLLLGWFVLLALHVNTDDLAESFQKMLYAQWMMAWLIMFVMALMALHTHEHGVAFIAGACVGVWLSDIAAYFTGKAWGKNKLCPAISPGKTWQGLAGGVFAGLLGASYVWMTWADMAWFWAIPLAILLVVTGVLGDLAESALKRVVGVKDSGTMLPGHGGLLDRMDALLPSLPLVAMVWIIFA